MTERKLITTSVVVHRSKGGSRVITAGKTPVVIAHDGKGVQVQHQVTTSVLERARAIAKKRVGSIFSAEAIKSAKAADKKGGVLIHGHKTVGSSSKKPVLR